MKMARTGRLYAGAEMLWKDRKRWCGMPLSFTRYRIMRKKGRWLKLVTDIGLLRSQVDEINLFRVDDIKVYQSFTNKFWGTGTITVYANDQSTPELRLVRIKDPYKVRSMITELLEEDRASRNVRIGEMHL